MNNLSGCNLIGLSNSLSIILGENLSIDELTILAAFLVSLGDSLALLAAKKAIEEASNKNSNFSSAL